MGKITGEIGRIWLSQPCPMQCGLYGFRWDNLVWIIDTQGGDNLINGRLSRRFHKKIGYTTIIPKRVTSARNFSYTFAFSLRGYRRIILGTGACRILLLIRQQAALSFAGFQGLVTTSEAEIHPKGDKMMRQSRFEASLKQR